MSVIRRVIGLSLGICVLSGCAVIRPGEVGVKQRLGTLDTKIREPGTVLINPFTTKVVKVPTRTMNIEVELSLPSKEGLNVSSVISILYNIDPEKARDVIQNVGMNYERWLMHSLTVDYCFQFAGIHYRK